MTSTQNLSSQPCLLCCLSCCRLRYSRTLSFSHLQHLRLISSRVFASLQFLPLLAILEIIVQAMKKFLYLLGTCAILRLLLAKAEQTGQPSNSPSLCPTIDKDQTQVGCGTTQETTGEVRGSCWTKDGNHCWDFSGNPSFFFPWAPFFQTSSPHPTDNGDENETRTVHQKALERWAKETADWTKAMGIEGSFTSGIMFMALVLQILSFFKDSPNKKLDASRNKELEAENEQLRSDLSIVRKEKDEAQTTLSGERKGNVKKLDDKETAMKAKQGEREKSEMQAQWEREQAQMQAQMQSEWAKERASMQVTITELEHAVAWSPFT